MPPDVYLAREGWIMMGGEIDWAGLPVVAGLIGVRDVDAFVAALLGIRRGAIERLRDG